jgi:hypothetical protein
MRNAATSHYSALRKLARRSKFCFLLDEGHLLSPQKSECSLSGSGHSDARRMALRESKATQAADKGTIGQPAVMIG